MKACERCYRLFDEEGGFCPIDGRPLRPVKQLRPPRDPDDLRIGASICRGRYQIWRVVADGGTGRVYQGLDLRHPRNVALKVLHLDVAIDKVALERFRREYALSSELPHDYIVEVFDFQRTEDKSWALVMEYLEGEELRAMLKREKHISPQRLIRMLSQLAVGLAEPHRRKVVHRDIKPDNVFLCGTPGGPRVKLLDFGSVRDNTEGAAKLTVIGTTIGSPFYMSPEQAQGLPELDHRADVWSLGAIAYECLTGKLPFKGANGPAILLSILGEMPVPPSIAGRRYGVPETVDDVIADALAKDMSTRISTVAELANRFGQAYGLPGTHLEWGLMWEEDLEKQIALAPRSPSGQSWYRANESALLAASDPDATGPRTGVGVVAGPDPWLQEMQAGSPPAGDNVFAEDDEFAMGVPTGLSPGLVIGTLVAALLAVIGLATYFFLR